MKNKAVVLVSGGLDSATVLGIVKSRNFEIYALSFDYAQRHNIELIKAKETLNYYSSNILKKHTIIKLDLRTLGGSALTDSNINVPKYNSHKDLGDEIPITYVPARNTIFLSYALGYAEIVGAFNIFLGVNATDYANYPDCRPEYIESFEKMSNVAIASTSKNQKQIKIEAPLIRMSKQEIIKTGLALGIDYSTTISCYDPSIDLKSCGSCHSCLSRLDAFAKNAIKDPIEYV
jgi:7-cyano-7-deazaguanine synthase